MDLHPVFSEVNSEGQRLVLAMVLQLFGQFLFVWGFFKFRYAPCLHPPNTHKQNNHRTEIHCIDTSAGIGLCTRTHTKVNHKQGQDIWKWTSREDLKRWKEVIDQILLGRLFQSAGAWNFYAHRPDSLLILGVRKNSGSVCLKLCCELKVYI